MTQITVDADSAQVRLDRILRKRLALKSLAEIYRLIRTGAVKVNGRKRKENYRLKEGDVITVPLPGAEVVDRQSFDDSIAKLANTDYFRKNFNLIFEDEHILVCNKPANVVVHSGTGHARKNTLIDLAAAYMAKSNRKGKRSEPALVHRLDKDTSGVILIAKDKQTLRYLHSILRERDIDKQYIALCHGLPEKKKGVIEAALVRNHEFESGTKVKVSSQGQKSRSIYKVTDFRNGVSRLEIKLETGRTHQIRVHLAHIGCPIIGDSRYGDASRDAALFDDSTIHKTLYLHAYQIGFFYPYLQRDICFSAPEPESFSRLWKYLCGPVARIEQL
ncbi:MAG: RluA family pseudouridine synthase [Chitinivibrionales bacterium]